MPTKPHASTHPSLAAILYWTAVTLAALGLAYGIATRTDLTVGILTGILAILIVRKKMLWGIIAVLFLPVVGELYRLPFGPDNGTLMSDVAIGAIVLVWLIGKINAHVRNKRSPTRTAAPQSTFTKPLAIFTAVAVFSLLVSLSFLTFAEVTAGSMYLIRLIEYVMFGIITTDTVRAPTPANAHPRTPAQNSPAQKLLTAMVIASLLIAIAGFIQLVVYPDLGKLEEFGWDPHQNRLVSTWLDPNFIAGFLTFMLAIVSGITLYTKSLIKKTGLVIILATLAVALFLTYSRSGYLAAAAALGIIGIFKSRKLLIGGILVGVIALNFLPRAQERVDDLAHSINSFIFNSSENPDPTARLRIVSWNQTFDLIQQRPLLGTGYNTLKYVKYNAGFVANTDVHSASGSDSSLLTILATTGILGLIPFLLLYWNALKLAVQNWKNKKLPLLWQGYGLGIFAGTIGLLVHSLFVNSLLFPQIMIFFWIGLGLLSVAPARSESSFHSG